AMRNVGVITLAVFATIGSDLAQTSTIRTDATSLPSDSPLVALTRVRIVDGTGAPARSNQTLMIKDGRILAFGDSTDMAIPEETKIIDLDGRTVLPGLVLLHEHTGRQPLVSARLFLAFGITTARTAGTDQPYADLNLKRRIDTGQAPGPELHLTGP